MAKGSFLLRMDVFSVKYSLVQIYVWCLTVRTKLFGYDRPLYQTVRSRTKGVQNCTGLIRIMELVQQYVLGVNICFWQYR